MVDIVFGRDLWLMPVEDPGFPDTGGRQKTIIWQGFYQKLYENEINWTGEGAHPWCPLDPLMNANHAFELLECK